MKGVGEKCLRHKGGIIRAVAERGGPALLESFVFLQPLERTAEALSQAGMRNDEGGRRGAFKGGAFAQGCIELGHSAIGRAAASNGAHGLWSRRNTIGAGLAVPDHLLKELRDLGAAHIIEGTFMQQKQIDMVGAELLQARLETALHTVPVEHAKFRPLHWWFGHYAPERWKTAQQGGGLALDTCSQVSRGWQDANLGGDDDILAHMGEGFAHEAFTAPIPVEPGRVEISDPLIMSLPEKTDRRPAVFDVMQQARSKPQRP